MQYLKGDQLRIRDLARDPLPAVIVFQNTNGKISYRLLGSLSAEVAAELPQTESNWGTLERDFESVLTAQGLFPAEAKAMVGTWRDSWFEEGARVFYVTPANEVESILPLQIEPRPQRIARVFVGRVEVFTTGMRATITAALEHGDRETLEKYGRFLAPFVSQFPNSRLMEEVLQKHLSIESSCATGTKAW